MSDSAAPTVQDSIDLYFRGLSAVRIAMATQGIDQRSSDVEIMSLRADLKALGSLLEKKGIIASEEHWAAKADAMMAVVQRWRGTLAEQAASRPGRADIVATEEMLAETGRHAEER